MLSPINAYFQQQEEPHKGCLLFLRGHILKLSPNLTEEWKYGVPMYCYNGKMFCYLWVHKKFKQPYIGVVEGGNINHTDLLQEKRKRMKILLIDPTKDIPLKTIDTILKEAMKFYK